MSVTTIASGIQHGAAVTALADGTLAIAYGPGVLFGNSGSHAVQRVFDANRPGTGTAPLDLERTMPALVADACSPHGLELHRPAPS